MKQTVTAIWTCDEIMLLQQALSLAHKRIVEIARNRASDDRAESVKNRAELEIKQLEQKLNDCRAVVDGREQARRTEEHLNFPE